MMGALDWHDHRLIVATSKTKRSADFIAFLAWPGACTRRSAPRLAQARAR